MTHHALHFALDHSFGGHLVIEWDQYQQCQHGANQAGGHLPHQMARAEQFFQEPF
jgi:hypothetical protein